ALTTELSALFGEWFAALGVSGERGLDAAPARAISPATVCCPYSPLTAHRSHGERAAAAAGALGRRVADAEAAAVEVFVVIDRHAVQVQGAAAVDDHRHAVHVVDVVELGVHDLVEVELVLEAAAAAADHAQPQVDLVGGRAGVLLLGDDALDLGRRLLGQVDRALQFDGFARPFQGNRHGFSSSF